jgi:hypothetical protein
VGPDIKDNKARKNGAQRQNEDDGRGRNKERGQRESNGEGRRREVTHRSRGTTENDKEKEDIRKIK